MSLPLLGDLLLLARGAEDHVRRSIARRLDGGPLVEQSPDRRAASDRSTTRTVSTRWNVSVSTSSTPGTRPQGGRGARPPGEQRGVERRLAARLLPGGRFGASVRGRRGDRRRAAREPRRVRAVALCREPRDGDEAQRRRVDAVPKAASEPVRHRRRARGANPRRSSAPRFASSPASCPSSRRRAHPRSAGRSSATPCRIQTCRAS